MSDLGAELRKTFSDFFGPQIEENENGSLGSRLLVELEELGYDFQEARQILSGEMVVDLPADLAADIKRYQEAAAKIEASDAEYEQGQTEAEQGQTEQVAKAYVKRTDNERLDDTDIRLLIGFGFGEEIGSADEETEWRGWRFVEGLTPRQIAERTGRQDRQAVDTARVSCG